MNDKTCPICNGVGDRPGCPECYTTFEENFASALAALYGTPIHRGHLPRRFDEKTKRERRAAELRSELSAAIRSEDFERACTLRDALRELEVKENVMV